MSLKHCVIDPVVFGEELILFYSRSSWSNYSRSIEETQQGIIYFVASYPLVSLSIILWGVTHNHTGLHTSLVLILLITVGINNT
jgi:hypothetical protein